VSQMTLARSTRTRPAPRKRPALQVVDAAPRARSHTGFVILCLALVVGGLLSALLLNTARAEGSFTLSSLATQQTRLHDTRITLEAELSKVQSPEHLAEAAEDLGLVSSPSTAVLRLSDNTVLGVAAQVDPADSRTVVTPFVSDQDTERDESADEGAVQGG